MRARGFAVMPTVLWPGLPASPDEMRIVSTMRNDRRDRHIAVMSLGRNDREIDTQGG